MDLYSVECAFALDFYSVDCAFDLDLYSVECAFDLDLYSVDYTFALALYADSPHLCIKNDRGKPSAAVIIWFYNTVPVVAKTIYRLQGKKFSVSQTNFSLIFL